MFPILFLYLATSLDLIFHVNSLPADSSHEISRLIVSENESYHKICYASVEFGTFRVIWRSFGLISSCFHTIVKMPCDDSIKVQLKEGC